MNSCLGWCSDFSYSFFRKILQTVKSNFKLHQFREAPKTVKEMNDIKLNKHRLFLRHDIDVSPRMALLMAGIEKSLGTYSTYFVMAESSLYDVEHGESRDILLEIKDMGHEIGLHIDPRLHKETGSLEKRIDVACKKLENTIDFQVSSFSFHQPRAQDTEKWKHDLLVSDRVNAYAEVLTGPSMKYYLADSSGCWKCWKYGEPLPRLSKPSKPLLQLLIHPIWWGAEHLSREERLRSFVLDEAEKLRDEIFKTINVNFDLCY